MDLGGMAAVGFLVVLVALVLRGIRGHGPDHKPGPNEETGAGDSPSSD
jgi:hypothetical protein